VAVPLSHHLLANQAGVDLGGQFNRVSFCYVVVHLVGITPSLDGDQYFEWHSG
jgi:hypothetical protein